jgi:hypothetical protein
MAAQWRPQPDTAGVGKAARIRVQIAPKMSGIFASATFKNPL